MIAKFLGLPFEGNNIVRYGDCIILYDAIRVVIYDCGHVEHATAVLEFLKEKGINSCDVIVSHNDSDHLDGVSILCESGKVKTLYVPLLLKHLDSILDKLDNRHKREPLKKQILEHYSNINILVEVANKNGCEVKDASENTFVTPNVKIVGPSEEWLAKVVAKAVDNNQSDAIAGETVMNAASIQVEVTLAADEKLLLTGDAAPETIETLRIEGFLPDLPYYTYIQLPHHGKLSTAEQIFEMVEMLDNYSYQDSIVYAVSDNTGTACKSGGSDDLIEYQKSHKNLSIKNTKIDGHFDLGNSYAASTNSSPRPPMRVLG